MVEEEARKKEREEDRELVVVGEGASQGRHPATDAPLIEIRIFRVRKRKIRRDISVFTPCRRIMSKKQRPSRMPVPAGRVD